MSYFDESLQGMDPAILRSSLVQMKDDVQQDVKDELYTTEEAEFILASLENLEEEIKGLKSFDNLPLKHKARIVAFMGFIFDILDEGSDFDEDDFDDEDLDEDDEDDDNDGDDGKKKKSKLKIESFPE